MSDINLKKTEKNIGHDNWFNGAGDVLESGEICYFICDYLETTHYDDATKEFYTYCKHKKQRLTENICNMNCDQYGKCATCRGFSAIRCQECTVPRK